MTTTPRERRQERTRQEILSTALILIGEKGADNLSLREIARRIDYSPAGLYEYFGSKDEIVDAVCNEANDQFHHSMEAVPTDLPPMAYLLALGEAYIRFADQHREQFLFLATNMKFDVPQTLPDPDCEVDATFMLLYHGVERAVDAGLMVTREDYGVLEICYSIWGLVHGLAMLQLRYLEQVPAQMRDLDRNALETMLKGLGCA